MLASLDLFCVQFWCSPWAPSWYYFLPHKDMLVNPAMERWPECSIIFLTGCTLWWLGRYLKTNSVNCEFLFVLLGKLSYETLPIGITLIRCFQSSRSKMSKIWFIKKKFRAGILNLIFSRGTFALWQEARG